MSSGVPKVREREEQSKRSLSKDLGFVPRIGFLRSSIGISARAKREKNEARKIPCILWDELSQRAWLLPAISALAFGALQFIEWKRYSFKRVCENKQSVGVEISYAPQAISTSEAERVLRQNGPFLVDIADGVIVDEAITFNSIVRRIWEGMSSGEDVCSSELTGRRLEAKDVLFGYDLSEAICSRKIELRKLQL